MLQQTRVASVVPVLATFIHTYPNAEALNAAILEDVKQIVAPLGFTSTRGPRLHLMAEEIVNSYEGEVPSTAADLLNLTGVGQYTASAVASIAFGIKVPAVDTNSIRVFSRLRQVALRNASTTAGKRSNYNTIYALTAPVMLLTSRPGDINQAIMELGQRICTISAPLCNECPLQEMCLSSGLEW
jgi:A/G-specific adenine glycosylase